MKLIPLFFTSMLLLNIEAYGQLTVYGSAQKASPYPDAFTMTKNFEGQAGFAVFDNTIDLTKDFQMKFKIYLGNKDYDGADGMSIIFHNDPRGKSAKGCMGGSMGFGDCDGAVNKIGIRPGIAVEFDTHQNGEFGDPYQDHIGLLYQGSAKHQKTQPVIMPNMEDGKEHWVELNWRVKEKTLALTWDGKAIFSHVIDLAKEVGESKCLLAFAGSTGALTNLQYFREFTINNTPISMQQIITPNINEQVPQVVTITDLTTFDQVLLEGQIGQRFILPDVLFERSKTTLLSSAHPTLLRLSAFMKANPTFRCEISGHTDNVGDANKNKRLSANRAMVVVNYLINQGVASNRLKSAGFGQTKPLNDNSTEELRALNRRVELVILMK